MERPGNLKQIAVTAGPLLAAAGIVALNPVAAAAAAVAHPIASFAAGLGPNLLASGIAALCKPGRFLAGQEHQEHLANHDILRLIRTAWGEAAAACLRKYLEAYPAGSLSITHPALPDALVKLIERIKPEDFCYSEHITLGTVRDAISASRRALMPSLGNPPNNREQAVKEHIEVLKDGLIASVTDALRKIGEDRMLDLTPELRRFLAGEDPRFPDGILGQLCVYVALHLKTDTRAQVALLHFTLQDLSDRQADIATTQQRIEDLSRGIYEAQSESQKLLLQSFEARNRALCDDLSRRIGQAFNQFVCPRLDPPFDTAADRREPSFTYRARATPLVGRETAMNTLIQFMADPRPGLWSVISGPAGSGKNRLAAELIASVRGPDESPDAAVPPGQWRAGFLRQSEAWLRNDEVKWLPDADTLIVVDYAGELDRSDLSDLLARLGDARELPECQVRVILIDRLPPDSDLGIASRLLRGNDRQTEIARNRWQSGSPDRPEDGDLPRNGPPTGSRTPGSKGGAYDPLALQPVTEENALQIAQEWSGSNWTSDTRDRVQQAFQRDRQLARPLFAALVGDAIRTDRLPPGQLNPVSVASTALDRLFHTHREAHDGYSENTKILLAAATAAQGLSEEDLFGDEQVLCGITGETHLSNRAIGELKRSLRKFDGYPAGPDVPPLEPDFLGGLFVLECLLGFSGKRAFAKADLLTSLAWERGRSPGAFLVRLASDFVGRAEQLSAATAPEGPSNPARVNELLVRLILSGLTAKALTRNGPAYVADIVYLASKAGAAEVAARLIEALEASYSRTPSEVDPGELAQAWFGFALSGDLPASATASAGRALDRIGQLLELHDTPEIALQQAMALCNATVVEPDPRQCEALAERIGRLRERHDTPEIALQQAKALYNATVGEPDPRQCEALAERIGQLRERHDTPEIALAQAMALHNATVVEPDPRQREALAERIGQLRERHDTPEIALRQAMALCNATAVEPDPRQREALAERIGQLRERHDTPEIALQQAKALHNATAVEPDPRQCEALAERIGQLRERHDTPEIALQQAKALYNATVGEPDPRQREALAERIGQLRERHDTPEIALAQAMALHNATAVEPDPRQCEALAERIGQLRERHDTPEIALQQAKALHNATAGEPDPRQCEALAERIGQLRERHDTPEIALQQAMALYNATVVEPDPRQREALAERIGQLRERHDTPEIALWQAQALCNATAAKPDPRQREALAERIDRLRERHDTPEIALQQAKALQNATVGEPDPRQCEALAERIGRLRERHDTPEIALQQAMALCNATVGEPDPRQREALAERIGRLRERHDTPEIALQQAKALYNATVVEPDPRQCEALAERIGRLRERHDTPEIALQQAKALYNATVVEPDPRQREALAERIGQLRERHDTPEIALWQAQALCNATAAKPDPRQREALAERIDRLRERHDTPEIALLQAKALENAAAAPQDPPTQMP